MGARILAQFATEARAVADRYALAHLTTDYNPRRTEGPYACLYRWSFEEEYSSAFPAYTPEDAVANLEEALWQAYHSNQVISQH